jgi:hypothetical protein
MRQELPIKHRGTKRQDSADESSRDKPAAVTAEVDVSPVDDCVRWE